MKTAHRNYADESRDFKRLSRFIVENMEAFLNDFFLLEHAGLEILSLFSRVDTILTTS